MGRVMRASWIAACMSATLVFAACGSAQSTPTGSPQLVRDPFDQLSRNAGASCYGTSMVYYPPAKEMFIFGGTDETDRALATPGFSTGMDGSSCIRPPRLPPEPNTLWPMTRSSARSSSMAAVRSAEHPAIASCTTPGRSTALTWHELEPTATPESWTESSPCMGHGNDMLDLLAPPPGWGPSPPNGDFTPNGACSDVGCGEPRVGNGTEPRRASAAVCPGVGVRPRARLDRRCSTSPTSPTRARVR